MAKSLSIGQVLNKSNGGFADVVTRAKQLRKLTQQLRKLLDKPLSQHIYVANIRDNLLIIGTDSAVWHTRVKYLAPVILEYMQQINGLEKLQRVEFRVQPANTQVTQPKPDNLEKKPAKNHSQNLKQALQSAKGNSTD